jgi:hypothetical protein
MLEEAGADANKPGMAHSVANTDNAGMIFFLVLKLNQFFVFTVI